MAQRLATHLAVGSVLATANLDGVWDDRIDAACCPYPEHDPRDYNWPYSHLLYSGVIPDVFGSFVPMTELNLTYSTPTGAAVVEYGKPISPSVVSEAPHVAFDLHPDSSSATLHTLLMVDPDVPFRDSPSEGEWLLWLVYDIPGNSTARGKTLVEYMPPSPRPCPEEDRLCLQEHRVTFVLLEQPHGPLRLHAEDLRILAHSDAGRARRKARDFSSRHRLGLQVAMNFFETWHDPGDGSFGRQPWWYVRDDESLQKVAYLIHHANRPSTTRSAPNKEEL